MKLNNNHLKNLKKGLCLRFTVVDFLKTFYCKNKASNPNPDPNQYYSNSDPDGSGKSAKLASESDSGLEGEKNIRKIR